MKTVRLTMAQALVRFLENQYIEVDGEQSRFVRGVFIIPGHGNVVGLGQALSQEAKHLEIWHGQNEQGMAHDRRLRLLVARGRHGGVRAAGEPGGLSGSPGPREGRPEVLILSRGSKLPLDLSYHQ